MPRAAKSAVTLTDKQLATMQAECLHSAQRTMSDGRKISYTLFVQWGDDSRYKKCRHCGKIETRGLCAAATTPTPPPAKRKRSSRASATLAAISLWDRPAEETTEGVEETTDATQEEGK